MLIRTSIYENVKGGNGVIKGMGRWIDEDLLERTREVGSVRWRFWEPADPMVVLGRSSRVEEEIRAEHCEADAIPIHRRRGGGKAVLLAPGMLVISVAAETARFQGHLFYPREINRLIEKTLTQLGVEDVYCRGISDLTLGDRKILGCCLYVSRARGAWVIFYQGSLLFDPDLDRVERALQHPPWEPDYRRGRPHREFMATLRQQGHRFPIMRFASHLDIRFHEELSKIF